MYLQITINSVMHNLSCGLLDYRTHFPTIAQVSSFLGVIVYFARYRVSMVLDYGSETCRPTNKAVGSVGLNFNRKEA